MIKFNNPFQGFTLGLDVRTLTMAEMEEGEFPSSDSDWKEIVEVTFGFLIFSIVFHV